ncbi:hypothetical protein O6H91_15G037800 [Diphasiastrum complanatum]|uniref:Uncharacterized protein n=1 Tax=Diphasiastrum complanatum TaxID=34168 RepID=A0ACC2BIC1_DIPCM|nr:hypothetical protein O6H91_15G037800 [Diphasiastrum complanatum]
MNFKFSNLLGAPYRGGNVLIVGDSLLLSPVGNRISATDLVKSESFTLPSQNSKNITKIAVSPNGAFLLSIDEDGRSLLINLPRRVVLHHFTFKGPVSAVKFSPNGSFFATGVGKLLQIWQTPGFKMEFTPFQLFKTYGGCHDTITALDWSPDSHWIIVGCKDLTARVYSIQNLVGYHPITLTGHRNTPIGVYFSSEKVGKDKDKVTGAYTISKDGAIFSWKFRLSELSTLTKDVSLVGTEAVADPSRQTRPLQAVANKPVRSLHGGNKLEGVVEDEDDDFTVLLDPVQPSEGITGADSNLVSHPTILSSSGPSPAKSVTKKKHKTEPENTEAMIKDSQVGGQKIRNDGDLSSAKNWEPKGGESQNEASLQDFQNNAQNGTNREEHEDGDGKQEDRRSIAAFEGELIQTGGKRKRSKQTEESHGYEDKMEPDDETMLQTTGVVGAKAATNYTIRPDAGKWELVKKHFFMQNAKLTACDYHKSLSIVVAGFSTGIFGLYQMPDFSCIHLLSISRTSITTTTFNDFGNWLVFGCAKLGQLLVWEWQSETYILKQQGHYFDVNCVAYSPDSQLIATGADDNKLKVWNSASGFCFVTFSEHTNAVTAVLFLPGNHAVLSASLDGTVRAWDLMRYRNFRTFTTPSPTQFVSLAADQSGEVICAGTLDSFQIYVWAMKTGRLLEVLSGHEGPVHGLVFSPTHEMLASSSWDKTVRLWDVFEGKGGVETFTHTHDVLTVSYRPDGKQLASTTLEGHIHFWDPFEGQLMGTIEGRRDIAGGRLMSDRRTAANSSSGKCFTTICYSADGGYLIAGGTSKYICMYDVIEQVCIC